MTTQTTEIIDRLVDAMKAADWNAITDAYAPDVLIDINLPIWRFQLQGREKAQQYFVEQTSALQNLHTVGHQVHHTDSGVIIEEEMRFDGEDGEYLWRAVDIVRTEGDRVAEITQYCTGCWDPATIARQANEAPMVRW